MTTLVDRVVHAISMAEIGGCSREQIAQAAISTVFVELMLYFGDLEWDASAKAIADYARNNELEI